MFTKEMFLVLKYLFKQEAGRVIINRILLLRLNPEHLRKDGNNATFKIKTQLLVWIMIEYFDTA